LISIYTITKRVSDLVDQQPQILALRRLIEEVNARNRSAIILYVDFKKAFDSIHRGKMLKILKTYEVPPNLLSAITKLYEDTRARIISPDGETDFIKITAGVLQGDHWHHICL